MTDIRKVKVKCSNCGKESDQLVVCSVNYLLGDKESNDKLVSHKQKCPYCEYEAISLDMSNNGMEKNNKLKRDEIIEITKEFIKKINEYEIFKIPNNLYLDYFNELEDTFNNYSFEEDKRFVTYGRLNFLKEELTQRLNDENLKEENHNWKDKWDNRLGAFWDLYDYIRGDRHISLAQVPEGLNFKDILLENDQYYKDGYICKQERDILLDMINEMKQHINNNLEVDDMGLFNKKDKYDIDAKENVPQFVYGIPDTMRKQWEKEEKENAKNNKYDVDEEQNIPQIVYGIPDNLRKQWEQEEKEKNEENVFSAFEGGYFGPSYFYYVNKINDNYQFRFGYSSSGIFVDNDINDPNIHLIDQNQEHYNKFIDELLIVVKDWESSYDNPNVMDGTQWNIVFEDKGKAYGGSNAFPENYDKAIEILKKYFNVEHFMKEVEKQKYDIDPEANMPREVYGIPDSVRNQIKYDIKPEDNVPQKVYGIPNVVDVNARKCPYCESTELWKYLYGEPTYDYDKDKYILGGCEITGNQPTYKCKKCNKDIYPNNNLIKPSNIKMSKESIRIGINNNKSNYVLLLNHFTKPESYDLAFADLNNLDGMSISDLSTNIPEKYYNDFVNRFYAITKDWQDAYSGNSNVVWSIKIDTDDNKGLISGNGSFPNNWNSFVDLISEYEKIFKNKKKIDIERIEDMKYNQLSLTDAVKNKISDPFWADVVIKYFTEEEKVNDFVAKLLFKDIMKYDDILNEFTKYLTQRTYDLKDAIEINGYTAKKISELNPRFTPSGVYTFMEVLRSDPERAEEIIKSGFANKDTIPPTINNNEKSDDELAEKYLNEIEDEVDQEMIKRGLLTIDNGRKIPAFGSCHTRWAIEKQLLKEKYNFDWQTPAEKNPGVKYD